jgi:Flp pilus assembly protein TadD
MIRAAITRLVCIALVSTATAAFGQTPKASPLKRGSPPVTQRPACAPMPTPPTVAADARRKARDLAQNGRQAAILGDRAAALAQLREASTVDPTDPELAYELARAYEAAGNPANAAREYCRFVALAPSAPEAGEARSRVTTLMPVTQSSAPSPASALFDSGLAAFERGQVVEAEAKFAAAIKAEPSWAEAYYDRAIARSAIGDQPQAASDLEEYLRLKPNADDRSQVVALIESLRRKPLSASQALGLGLVVPGAGQFYTRRPVRGVISLAATTGAIAFALQSSSKTKTIEQTATDPFGLPYTYTTTKRITEQPNLVPGLMVAGAIAIGSAVDAYMFARRSEDGGRRLAVSAVPTAGGITARVSLLLR